MVLTLMVFTFRLDTKIVPAERDVVEPVNAFVATMLRPATVDWRDCVEI